MAAPLKDAMHKTMSLVMHHGAASTFTPTSNERNSGMLAQAASYSVALKALSRELSSWNTSADVGLSTIATLLSTPLPRVFDESASGAAFPVRRELKLVGNNVRLEQIAIARQELTEKLSRDVLTPLSLWQEAYAKISHENKKVEELRTELDARRLKMAAVQHRYEHAAADPSSKPEKVEDLAAHLQHEGDKLARISERYALEEAAVFQAVLALIQDVHVLRDYAAAAITLMQSAFTTSLGAFQLPQYVPDWTLPDNLQQPQVAEPQVLPVPPKHVTDMTPADAMASVRSSRAASAANVDLQMFSSPVGASADATPPKLSIDYGSGFKNASAAVPYAPVTPLRAM